jgi:two-component system OmpR family sensor kinase
MKAVTKSLIYFLVIYLGSIAILGGIIGYFYFHDQKDVIIDKMHVGMRYKAEQINAKLEYYHNKESEEFVFAEEGYDIALYSKEKELIAATFDKESIDFEAFFYHVSAQYYLVESLYKQYLGVKYIVIRKSLPKEELSALKTQMIYASLYAISFLLFVAILLAKVMLFPIKNLIASLKTFIKNTTHEMNTPISTILMSYEYFDKSNLNTKQLRSLDRIEIATKTLSSLYTDLTYISFHEHITYEKTEINVKEILQERVKHIDTFIRFKGLHVTYALEDFMFPIDERKLILLIDNLLSNAIKFSKPKGEIHVCLNKNCLSVKDQGIGIAKEDQEKIFKRFETSNGFGVGLDIVNNICKEHHIKIVLESEISKGSEFILYWPKT